MYCTVLRIGGATRSLRINGLLCSSIMNGFRGSDDDRAVSAFEDGTFVRRVRRRMDCSCTGSGSESGCAIIAANRDRLGDKGGKNHTLVHQEVSVYNVSRKLDRIPLSSHDIPDAESTLVSSTKPFNLASYMISNGVCHMRGQNLPHSGRNQLSG